MKNSKQHEFSTALIVVAVVVAIALIGFIAWRMYDSNQQKSGGSETSQPEANSQQPEKITPTDPNAGYVVIKDWGVRFKPVDGLTGVQYFKPSSVTEDAISITTEELGKADAGCSTSSPTMVLGLLTRSTDPQPYAGGVFAKIGEYSYQYRVSSAKCGTSTGDLETKTRNLIRESIKSLEAAR